MPSPTPVLNLLPTQTSQGGTVISYACVDGNTIRTVTLANGQKATAFYQSGCDQTRLIITPQEQARIDRSKKFQDCTTSQRSGSDCDEFATELAEFDKLSYAGNPEKAQACGTRAQTYNTPACREVLAKQAVLMGGVAVAMVGGGSYLAEGVNPATIESIKVALEAANAAGTALSTIDAVITCAEQDEACLAKATQAGFSLIPGIKSGKTLRIMAKFIKTGDTTADALKAAQGVMDANKVLSKIALVNNSISFGLGGYNTYNECQDSIDQKCLLTGAGTVAEGVGLLNDINTVAKLSRSNFSVLPDTHSMSPTEIDNLLIEMGVLTPAGNPTGKRLAVLGDTLGKRLDSVDNTGVDTFNYVYGDLRKKLGDDLLVTSLAGNWEARHAYALALTQSAQAGDLEAAAELDNFVKTKLRTGPQEDIDALLAQKSQTLEAYQNMNVVELRGGTIIQHTDNPNLAKYALSTPDLERLKSIDPKSYEKIAQTLEQSGSLTPEQISDIQSAANKLGLKPKDMVDNINTKARNIMTGAIADPTAQNTAAAKDFYLNIMDPNLNFYSSGAGVESATAYSSLLDTQTILHGHSTWDELLSGPNKNILTNNTEYKGILDLQNQSGNTRLINYDVSISPGMRTWGISAPNKPLKVVDGVQQLNGFTPNPVNQSGYNLLLNGTDGNILTNPYTKYETNLDKVINNTVSNATKVAVELGAEPVFTLLGTPAQP